MERLKNQQGYALLVVLLVVVLFLALSATFMAGSLNNARQEKTIDTTNQALASAEMGARFYNSDFERELGLIKDNVSVQTQETINKLILCIKGTATDAFPDPDACDTQEEVTVLEGVIDQTMRTTYVNMVFAKISALNSLATVEVVPFSADQINYSIVSAAGTELNVNKIKLTDVPVTALPEEKVLKYIRVELGVEGTSENVTKDLSAFFIVEVPDTFLNSNESIVVETVLQVNKEGLKYEDIFGVQTPTQSCSAIIAELTDVDEPTDIDGDGDLDPPPPDPEPPYDCVMTGDMDLEDLIALIGANNLDPTQFKVHVDDFVDDVCSTNCNSLDFQGITIVVSPDDDGAFNNMNNLVNASLLVNGTLSTGNNLNNLGKNGKKQIVIVKELEVGTNIQNMYYTNFLVLGNATGNDADLEWGLNQHIEIDNYSNLCIDIDRIDPTDLIRLAKEVKLTDTGKLIYYTAYADKEFVLTGKNAETMSAYVIRTTDYTTFLNSCGVGLKDTVIDSTEVAVPYVLDPDYEFYVEY
ncbi:hypothetical protein [Indiicoccus explosivorum]|uniref:hypothetical protein n=1 Tax=Indiicoccus explosivorum TaxID=1917864 RepID=UPI000B442EEB|nr:hypothetical protein [Indiicoccus explosivorum]